MGGDAWGDAPADATKLVATAHELRRKPIGSLQVEDLRLLLGQREGVPVLVPRALDIFERDPLAEGDYYPGDLLTAVLKRVPAEHWAAHPGESARLRALVATVELGEADDDELRADIAAHREGDASQPSPRSALRRPVAGG
ncbi:contact-dependent growth inhibition system immunity protein [Actinoplanes oblitus]|uniref:Contact-dependent growth inhibition system immunity protein n=1 Tax=Actinoplanes oblitus TaxID=3040509 RepID=A0ABY8WU34_9ACTN|nr:contact-dependent growth inhibition system immunity protein [Actinoplanes oblitus]WIN00684.1 contact-dependent growth inhibition system immunity protein [Actinoplanes oblitus]